MNKHTETYNSVAKRIDAEFKEYWQFLDAYVDLTSEEGLQRLETHLNNLMEEQVKLFCCS